MVVVVVLFVVPVTLDCFLVLLLENGDRELNEEIKDELLFFFPGVENVVGSGKSGKLNGRVEGRWSGLFSMGCRGGGEDG